MIKSKPKNATRLKNVDKIVESVTTAQLGQAFGQTIRTARLARRLSQQEFAHACDLDRSFISMLERGIKQPSLSTIFTICRTLHISPAKILTRVETRLRILNNSRTAPRPSQRL